MKINPGFIGLSIDDSSNGCHANKNMFKTPWKIDSINPIQRTSGFFNSFIASVYAKNLLSLFSELL